MMKKQIVLGFLLLFVFFGMQEFGTAGEVHTYDSDGYTVVLTLDGDSVLVARGTWDLTWNVTFTSPNALVNATVTVTSSDIYTKLMENGVVVDSIVLDFGNVDAAIPTSGPSFTTRRSLSSSRPEVELEDALTLVPVTIPVETSVSEIAIGDNYLLVGQTMFTNRIYDMTYIASIDNLDKARTDVKAVLSGPELYEGGGPVDSVELYFGDVAANSSKLSKNTFTIRHPITAGLPNLQWTFSPSANAGEDQVVASISVPYDPFNPSYDAVTLDGSASSDPQGLDLVEYIWTVVRQPEGSDVEVPLGSAETWAFTPTKAGIYIFKLTVSNGVLSNHDTVTVGAFIPY